MWVVVRREHFEEFCKFLYRSWADEIEENELTVQLTYDQANYGYGTELTEAAEAGCEFYGYHGQGSSYENADFYSEGRGVQYIYRGADGCGVVVDGDTPIKRRENLRSLEVRMSAREDLMNRMNNPLYDIAQEVANG
jgi:hypothetical protein